MCIRDRDTTALGTYGFASPEQYGFAKTDARSDVFSLGRLLGFMLTGVYPDASDYEQRLADDAAVPDVYKRQVEPAEVVDQMALS